MFGIYVILVTIARYTDLYFICFLANVLASELEPKRYESLSLRPCRLFSSI